MTVVCLILSVIVGICGFVLRCSISFFYFFVHLSARKTVIGASFFGLFLKIASPVMLMTGGPA